MQTFTVTCIALGIAILILGGIMLAARKRLLAFLRARYESALREDGLSTDELARRTPSMRAVVIVSVGFLLFGGLLVSVGVMRAGG